MKRSLIERVVEPGAITAVFQPILDLRGDEPWTCAVEGLSRGPRGSTLEAPDILFDFARRKHEEPIVDRAAISSILNAAREVPEELRVHLNVHATTVSRDPRFAEYLRLTTRCLGIDPRRLTVEVVEHSEPIDEAAYLDALDALRRLGIEIALDDVGSGTSNLRMILLTRPSLLKADRCLIHGVASDPYREATIRAIRLFADQVGARIVAEGIETEADLRVLRALGVEFGQGYLFARPAPAATLFAPAVEAGERIPGSILGTWGGGGAEVGVAGTAA